MGNLKSILTRSPPIQQGRLTFIFVTVKKQMEKVKGSATTTQRRIQNSQPVQVGRRRTTTRTHPTEGGYVLSGSFEPPKPVFSDIRPTVQHLSIIYSLIFTHFFEIPTPEYF